MSPICNQNVTKKCRKCRIITKICMYILWLLYVTQKSFNKHLRTQKHVKNASPNVTKMLPKSTESAKSAENICNRYNKEYRAEMVCGDIKKCIKSLEKALKKRFRRNWWRNKISGIRNKEIRIEAKMINKIKSGEITGLSLILVLN